MNNFCLVQLTPKDMRCQNSINLGLEIIKKQINEHGWNVDVVKFGEVIDKDKYDIIGFSIFYVTQFLNLIPFLKSNHIEPLSTNRQRKPLLMAGGQGVQNPLPISDFIDVFCIGEGENTIIELLQAYENNTIDKLKDSQGFYLPKFNNEITFTHIDTIESEPVIYEKRAMIELTRGCKHRCKFCQYGWTAGRYREKDIELVKQQIISVTSQGVKNINFLSCNLGGYSKILELLNFCLDNKIRIMNTDMRIDEYTEEMAILLDKLKVRTLKVGVESFCEATRDAIKKDVSNKQLEDFVDRALRYQISNLHFYLIWGLPTEKGYEDWFYYLKHLKEKINTIDRPVRLEYSITNFEPSIYTPYEHEALIDFDEKDKFLQEYFKVMEDNGYIQNAEDKNYGNMHGRIGRKEEPYLITMWLLHGNKDLGRVLLDLDIKQVGRSIDAKVYYKIKALAETFHINDKII